MTATVPAVQHITLYGMAQEVIEAIEMLEFLESPDASDMTDEDRDAAKAAVEKKLAETIEKMPAKIDACAAFTLRCAAEAQLLKERASDLMVRAGQFSGRVDRMKTIFRRVIEALPLDKKQKYQKLEGEEHTVSLRAGSTSVLVHSLDAVPSEYRRIKVEMPEQLWIEMRTVFLGLSGESPDTLAEAKVIGLDAPKTPIKEAIQAEIQRAAAEGRDVRDFPGASLVMGEPSVIVK